MIEWVTDVERFTALADEWERLLPDDSTPFDLHHWYASWWEAFGEPYELAVCTVRRDGELAAAFPLARDGEALIPLSNDQGSYFRPLARDEGALDELVDAVLERMPAPFELDGLPAEDPSVAGLRSGSRRAGMFALVEPAYASPIVATDGDYEQWKKEKKSGWGAPLERFGRKMGRDFEAEFSIVEAPADLEAELTDGFRVEASGWKGKAGTAIVSSPQNEAFYRALARAFDAHDELRLSRVTLDGRLAAFDYCLLHRRRLYLLKTAFDEDFRKLAPGLVMRLFTVQRCFELGLDAHDLTGTESEWKMKFATTVRPHVTLRAYGRSGAFAYAYRSALRPRLKRAYRRLRPKEA